MQSQHTCTTSISISPTISYYRSQFMIRHDHDYFKAISIQYTILSIFRRYVPLSIKGRELGKYIDNTDNRRRQHYSINVQKCYSEISHNGWYIYIIRKRTDSYCLVILNHKMEDFRPTIEKNNTNRANLLVPLNYTPKRPTYNIFLWGFTAPRTRPL